MKPTNPPLIAHVIHALGVGGLENGLVNLINHMPESRYRHAIVCMTHSTDFRQRIRRHDVDVFAVERDSAPLWRTYLKLIQLFRRLRPSIVHSRNLSGLDAVIPALCAGVRVRIHGEHGRDVGDLDGSNPKFRRLRRYFKPFISHYTAVSKDLERYLVEGIGVPAQRVSQIYNGVDSETFHPRREARLLPFTSTTDGGERILIGTVGRLQPVKDQLTLVRAFAHAKQLAPQVMSAAYLVIVGEGPSRAALEAEIESLDLGNWIVLLGARDDVPAVLRSLDLFVLPSLAEGVSNTILEAMATGLPVLATRVGGNPELVVEDKTGQLVGSGDWQAMGAWIIEYLRNDQLRRNQGLAARRLIEERFSMNAMVSSYMALYDRLLASPRSSAQGTESGKDSVVKVP